MSNCVGHRWSKFYWDDYANDVGLQSCSLAAQGLWMRLLCLAHNSDGYVLLNGRRPTLAELSAISRGTLDEVSTYIKELLTKGVASRTRGGVLYSRRMVKDIKASAAGREAVMRRWQRDETATSEPHRPNRDPNSVERKKERKEEHYPTGSAPPAGGAEPPPAVVVAEEGAPAGRPPPEPPPVPAPIALPQLPPPIPPSAPIRVAPRTELWALGPHAIQRLTGKTNRAARSFVGKLLARAKDDAARVLALIREAEAEAIIEPAAWLWRMTEPLSQHEQIRRAGNFGSFIRPLNGAHYDYGRSSLLLEHAP